MNNQSWTEFDNDLRIRIARTRQTCDETSVPVTNKMGAKTNMEDSQTDYEQLTTMVRESIDAIVPAKTWTKKNGRVVSEATKALYESRTRQYQSSRPTQETRKKWNRKIRSACIKDYRTWVTGCTERIERADNRGDTKAIYAEVKRLSGLISRGANTTGERLTY